MIDNREINRKYFNIIETFSEDQIKLAVMPQNATKNNSNENKVDYKLYLAFIIIIISVIFIIIKII